MSGADIAALIERWQARDAAGAGAYFCADGAFHEARGEPIVGRAAMVAEWERYFRSVPDWRLTVHDIFGSGDRFAVTYTWDVAAADGGRQRRPGCAIVHVRDGAIALWREYRAGV